MINSSVCAFLGTFVFMLVVSDVLAQHRKKNHHKPILSAVTSSRDRKPNIVLILTDDQDVELGSLNFMPKTLRAIRDKGAEFRHAYVTTPMCCPSRSSLLTGMYMHNHNVYTNNDNCSSAQWQATYETRSFATYLSNAGYRTGYFGKYLNKYNGSYIPPGWREWGGLIMNSKYYNYSINMNGKKIKHGFDYSKDYYSDLIVNDSIAFLKQSKRNSAHKPVMLTMSFPAPHGPEDSAPQFSHLFFNVTTHHTPSYDHAPNLDKQWILQITNKMQPIHKQFTDLLMTKRLQTLQSVDSAVERIIQEFEALGELHNTYIIYTSDHGYHLGQFGLIKGKSFPFEFDVRVPFLVRGPGVVPGTVVDDIILNIDLAPTFLDMAGVETPPHMDGHSVLPLFLNSKRKRLKWPDTFLIESSGRREHSDGKSKHSKQHHHNNVFIPPVDGTIEISPSKLTTIKPILDHDSVEETDVVGEFPEEDDDDGEFLESDNDDEGKDFDDEEVEEEVEDHLKGGHVQLDNQLMPEVPLNKREQLDVDCLLEQYQLPCQQGQKWYCQYEYGRWRKHKCKLQLPISYKKSYKKCACFTPNGLVYKKIPINTTKKLNGNGRTKREIYLNHNKSNTSSNIEEHEDSILKSIGDEINGLHDMNITFPEEQILQKTSLNTNTVETTPQCAVDESGKVNCSVLVYHNRKVWRQSRHYIDNQILRLRQKLDNLKEIRRHLKYSRPSHLNIQSNTTVDTNILSPNETQQNNTIAMPVPTKQSNRKRKKLLHFKEEVVPKNSNLEPVYTSNGANITSKSTVNHHRHQDHHRHSIDHNRIQTRVNVTSTLVKQNVLDTTVNITTGNTSIIKPVIPNNEIHVKLDHTSNNEYCHCETEEPYKLSDKELMKEAKQKLKNERVRKRQRRQRKKAKFEKECLSEKMNCFSHDSDHWRTFPFWTSGPFCFCMNANNNTYSCVRTINSTHNFLYCEFTTGEISFYNLRIDPFQLQNRYNQLKLDERLYLHEQLIKLMSCKGKSCYMTNDKTNLEVETPEHHQRFNGRRFLENAASGLLPLPESELTSSKAFFYNTHSNKLPNAS